MAFPLLMIVVLTISHIRFAPDHEVGNVTYSEDILCVEVGNKSHFTTVGRHTCVELIRPSQLGEARTYQQNVPRGTFWAIPSNEQPSL